MNIEQILKLVDAGYTKDEIAALTVENPVEKVVDEKQEEIAKTETTEYGNILEQVAKLAETVNSIKASQQKQNIQNITVDSPKDETVEDILAKIINRN